MQIVKASGKYRVYGENIEVYDKLEPDFYQFMVDDDGPCLIRSSKPEITGKVYGADQKKIDKCFKTYSEFNRSLGIMLVGDKGNGKTLFAKQLCLKMINAGYPVINVNNFHPILPTFMTQISQECVFLFDEFEKMFEHDEQRGSAQNLMLSTFDGINMTKKMFIITCNDIHRLSQYIFNRPGRFHYSFTFSEPSYDDIHCYLMDNIDPKECVEDIEKITLFSYINGLNYDCLRSLSFELNNGYTLVDSFDDLNIGYSEDKSGSLKLVYENGEILKGEFTFEPFSDRMLSVDIRTSDTWINVGTIGFKISDIRYSKEKNLYILPNNFSIHYANPATTEYERRKEAIFRFRDMAPAYLQVDIKKREKDNPLRRDYASDRYGGLDWCGEEELTMEEPVLDIEQWDGRKNKNKKCSSNNIITSTRIGFHPLHDMEDGGDCCGS